MMLQISRQIGRCSESGDPCPAVITAHLTPTIALRIFDYRLLMTFTGNIMVIIQLFEWEKESLRNARSPSARVAEIRNSTLQTDVVGRDQTQVPLQRSHSTMTTMDLMSSDAPLKMLSMSTGGLSKETTTLLEERTPTTPEGLWRAFLQGSHHAPAPTTPRMDIIGRSMPMIFLRFVNYKNKCKWVLWLLKCSSVSCLIFITYF